MVFTKSVRAVAGRTPSLTRSLATPAFRIGDKKVAMSIFEQDKYINYQRIEDNLAVVRQR
jgi:aconitate hydratase